MEKIIRDIFGSGSHCDRGIHFNYCRLGNSFGKDPRKEHYHEFCIPVSNIPYICKINGLQHVFEYVICGKPFDNTVRNVTHPIILKHILGQIKQQFASRSMDQGVLTDSDTHVHIHDLDLDSKEFGCISRTMIQHEKAPLFETKYFKIVLNDKNQYCPGRLFIVSKYHIDMSKIKHNK